MQRRLIKILFLLTIVIPVVLVFKKIFLPGPVVWGDAPYFFKESLSELLRFPSAWVYRGNSFGGVNTFLWISPIMFLYGLLGKFLNNDLIIRILFYFPALALSVVSPVIFTKYLKLSSRVQFFASLFYVLNTYFILLVDGGQVGIVLAYSLFPLVLTLLLRNDFLVSLISIFLLSVIDVRVAAICFLTAILWFTYKKEFKKIGVLFFVGVFWIGLSAYWLIPLLKLGIGNLESGVSSLQLVSLLNSLLLYQPHWPLNQFGNTTAPAFYFIFVPVLIFASFLMKPRKEKLIYFCAFLVFAFLAKGETPPLGEFYSFILRLPFGVAFRDSTKFFIPLILFGGILIGQTVDSFKNKIAGVLVYGFAMILILPAILGGLTGVLGKNIDISDFEKIKNLVLSDSGFERISWFTEKNPFAFHTDEKQSIDAKDLVNLKPLASFNAGTSDLFNFMDNTKYDQWFDLLGIRYLVLSGNPRKISLSDEEVKDWNRLNEIVTKSPFLKKLNLGTSFDVYENKEAIMPHTFNANKIYAVVGGQEIYSKLDVRKQPAVFFEDGKLDPYTLQNIASDSAILVFNNKTEIDLKMSFLQKYFSSIEDVGLNQWAIRKPEDYLQWKYDLLVNGIDTKEFDYEKGIAFSTKPQEKVSFNLPVSVDGSYLLEVRSMGDIMVGDKEFKNKNLKSFEWHGVGQFDYKKGKQEIILENVSGTSVVNIVALVPVDEMTKANQLKNNFVGYFKKVNPDQITQESTGRPYWTIMTDDYNSNWQLRRGIEYLPSYPLYSSLIGFYIDPMWQDTQIVFRGEESIRWGIYFSVLTLLVVIIGSLYARKNLGNN
jgi:hypothetical protein